MRHVLLLTAVALNAAFVCLPAAARDRGRPLRSVPTARCVAVGQSASAVIGMWIGARTQALPAPCALATTTYRPGTLTVKGCRRALVEPLGPQSQPGHRLYLVTLVTHTRSVRYLLDLARATHRRWQVDLWAEL